MVETAPPVSDAETAAIATPPDLVAAQLLDAAFERSPLSVFDETTAETADEKERLALLKLGYWALHGGWLAYLKEEPLAVGGGGRARNPEMEALRSEYMRLRLNTFWWTFGMSIAGLVFSIVSILIAIFYGGRIFP